MKLNNNDDSHNSGLNLLIYNMLLDIESHPAWVCGLKQGYLLLATLCLVTPCVGVWIETAVIFKLALITWSHPAWVCGLKPLLRTSILVHVLSHPAWVCGLKLISPPSQFVRLSHTLRGCVD